MSNTTATAAREQHGESPVICSQMITPGSHSPECSQRQRDDAINQRIFETSLDLLLVVERKGTLLRVSPSCEAILGYAPGEMVGHSAKSFLFADDLERTREEMRLARRGRVTRNFECRYVHKKGHLVPLAWTGVWSEKEQQHFFIGRDMSERMKLEQQLHRSHRLEALGQLTGGIAHDINNILTVIIGMNELMMNSVAANPELSAIAKTIDEAAERGAQLAQRMLAFARRQRLEARTLQLNDTVGSIAAMLKPTLGEHIRIDVELCEGLWPALADPSQLENAIINLAVNARDAMPNGGRLVIETGNVHLDEHYAAQNADVVVGDYVAVIVTDSGTGMRPEVIERAFEPFFTTKDVGYGTGLGLSTVYGFAKQSRGHVKIYSELGHGTSVKLYLPRSEGTQVEAISSGRQVAQARGRENILVVEDEASVRKVAVSILENLGYCVQQAGDGWEALAILGKPGCVDLLFTDMVMPNGLGGEELLQKARELRPGLKALFTSGYSEKFLRNQRRTAPDVAVLNKPYRKDTLANAIRTALG